MPTHNRVDVIGLAIRSVLDQSESDFELLVVGDGCPTATGDIVAGFRDPRIRFFDLPKAPHYGYANRNIALREARGELIGFAADDDLLFHDHLELVARSFDAEGTVFGYSQALWVSTDAIAAPFLTNLEFADELQIFMEQGNSIPASCVIYPSDSLPSRDAWPEDVTTAGDWHLWRRVIRENPGGRVAYCSTPTVLHFSAKWKQSRSSRSPELAMLLDIADRACWWPAALKPPPRSEGSEQQTYSELMRANPIEWSAEIRRAAWALTARIAWDKIRQMSSAPGVADLSPSELLALHAELAGRTADVSAMRSSRSWRITAPLRALSKLLRNRSE